MTKSMITPSRSFLHSNPKVTTLPPPLRPNTDLYPTPPVRLSTIFRKRRKACPTQFGCRSTSCLCWTRPLGTQAFSAAHFWSQEPVEFWFSSKAIVNHRFAVREHYLPDRHYRPATVRAVRAQPWTGDDAIEGSIASVWVIA